MSTRKHYNEYDVLTEAWILIKVLLKMSPKGAALLTATLNLEALTRKSNKGCRNICDSPCLYII